MTIHFLNEVERLKKMILSLGAMVEESAESVVRAVAEHHTALAAEIIARDREIDEHEVRVEEECLKIIALHQPVAGDLRYLIAMLKINHDLERIGDLAVEIAEQVPDLNRDAALAYENDLQDLARMARRQVADAIQSVIHLDAQRARRVWQEDDALDDLEEELGNRILADLPKHVEDVRTLFHLAVIARSFERMGDHATNIAKDVIYMVEGEIARHRGKEFKATEG